MKAVLTRSEELTNTGIKSYYFSTKHMPHYIAGQFTELSLNNVGKHWFTISNAPNDKELRITTRLTGSEYKKALDSLKMGDEVDIAEPMGDFVLPVDSSSPILMVAAGIGITPFLSILEEQAAFPEGRSLNLIYVARSSEDFIDTANLKSVLSSFKKVTGKLTAEMVINEASKLDSPFIYISGPEGLVEKLIKDIKSSGFPEQQLVADYFPGYN